MTFAEKSGQGLHGVISSGRLNSNVQSLISNIFFGFISPKSIFNNVSNVQNSISSTAALASLARMNILAKAELSKEFYSIFYRIHSLARKSS